MKGVTALVEQLVLSGTVIVAVIVGFVMGFKAARPDEKLITRDPDMGPTEDTGEDIWTDAMQKLEPVEAEERVETMKR